MSTAFPESTSQKRRVWSALFHRCTKLRDREMRPESVVWEWPDRGGLEHLQYFFSTNGNKTEGLIVAKFQGKVINFRHSTFYDSDWRFVRGGIFVLADRGGGGAGLGQSRLRSGWKETTKAGGQLIKCHVRNSRIA
jgi:hypothetical protein